MGMAAVACLGFVFAACDDDNGGTDMGMDMAVTVHDMAMNNGDMTGAPPDLNPGPGTAQLIIADIEGTYPAATPLPFTHLLFTSQSIPEQAGAAHQMDNRVLGAGNFLFGCTADYYDGATTFPASQANAGEITYKGYNTVLAAADSRSGAGVYNPPIPDTIKCEFVQLGPLGTYVCGYGDVAADGGVGNVMGENPAAVLFPPLPQGTGGACAIGTAVGTVCEQHPMVGGTTMITETLAGAGTYTTAVSTAVRTASAVNVLTVNGTAPANPAEPFAGVVLDGTKDLTITWNCKPGSTTPGDMCSTLSFTGLIALSNPTQTLPLGVAQCVVPSKTTTPATSGTLTLPKDYITKILGGSTTGAALLVLAQLNGTIAQSGGHEVVPTAGQGFFKFAPKQ